ncbi:MAG: hypothetical protein ACT443_11620 [Gemmatimonadota bacterium]
MLDELDVHSDTMSREQKRHVKFDALRGIDRVDSVSRLCAMNLLLHGVGPMAGEEELPIQTDDPDCAPRARCRLRSLANAGRDGRSDSFFG